MITFRNDKRFKQYLNDVERLMPELATAEINLLKKCYRRDLTPEEAVKELVDFSDKADEVFENEIS